MQKINFKNLPDTSTPLNAENLNLMQENIETAINSIELSGGGDEVGTVKMFSGSTAPQGWLICDGSAISRSEYAELFSAIGTTYGSGNGTTTFNIPNIKGRTVVGLDSNDTDFSTLGKTLGEKTHTLTIDEMPSHSHNFNGGWSTGSVAEKYSYGSVNTASTYGVENTGGNQPHNIIQPSIVLNYIIKASATTTTQGQIIDSLSGDSTTDAPSVHAVNNLITTSNNGNVLKFNNGLMIITQKIDINTSINTSWQGHYISSTINMTNFPVEFTNLLSCTLTLESTNSTNAWLMTDGTNSVTKAGNARLISTESISTFKGNANIIAIGTWK